jgi:hypothetical protein
MKIFSEEIAMKRLIILAAAMALAPMAGAQLYKYVDKDGKTVYSDQPPAGIDSKQISAGGPRVRARRCAQDRGPARQGPGQGPQGRRREGEEVRRRRPTASRRTRRAAPDLKANYQMFVDGGRIQRNNEKGERELMSDAEIESARERTRREMEEACKK